jgi:hypothetical protein
MNEIPTPEFRDVIRMLNHIFDLHMAQEITLPDGSWGTNCKHCDGWEYPCPTIAAAIKDQK